MLQCYEDNCHESFASSGKTYVDLAYCGKCRKHHSKDLLEIIDREGKVHIFTSQAEAEAALSQYEADLRLDLHKTLDTIEATVSLPPHSCCISFVGRLTVTRMDAREEIQSRIASGQLQFGALVFARGSRRDPNGANAFHEVGSKAWFNVHVKAVKNALFVDDSDDHVLSVRSIGVPSVQIMDGQSLIKIVGNL